MKQVVRTFIGVAGIILAVQTWADVLVYPQERIQQCNDNREPVPRAELKKLIQQKNYQAALATLSVPDKSTASELRYWYGKVLYLQANERVVQRLAENPDPALMDSAIKHINEAANAGYAPAMFDQATLLTPIEDRDKRLRLLRKAADKKYVSAMLSLARDLFLTSQTFEQRVEAQSLIQKAAEMETAAKITLARYYLHEDPQLVNTTGYDKDIDKAISLLKEAAHDCDAYAAYFIYELAKFKHKPNPLDAETAIAWLKISAQLGYPRAQGDLAEYYYKVEPDIEQAIEWGERAAKSGDTHGMIVLGNIYYTGTGVDRDLSAALEYYEQALVTDRDNRYVQDQLGMMYYKGEGAEADFEKAADLCKIAANKGQPGCQYYLGLMYVNGEGVTQDIDRGIDWMKKSAAQDFITAKNWLRENW